MDSAKIQIKHRHTGAVLFEYTPTEEQQASGLAMRAAAEAAVRGGTHLRGAYLGGADGEKLLLVGDRPTLEIGPIGSRNDVLRAWLTEQGVYIQAGCFFGTRQAFADALAETHGDNTHGQEYAAALILIDKHAELWTPAVEAVAEAA